MLGPKVHLNHHAKHIFVSVNDSKTADGSIELKPATTKAGREFQNSKCSYFAGSESACKEHSIFKQKLKLLQTDVYLA